MILYIIYSQLADKYYIGVTDEIERRLKEHNGKQSHYTGKIDGEWVIKFVKEYKLSTEAFKEEKRLKRAKNRKYLEWYISKSGPLAQR